MFVKLKSILQKKRGRTHEAVHRELRYAEVMDIKRRRQRRLKFFLGLILIAAVLAIFFLLVSNLFVKQIVCNLDGETCEKELQAKTEVLKGRSMFGGLKLTHPYLSVDIRRMWPNGVSVTFFKPKILFTFRSSTEPEKTYSLTENGYVVSYISEQSLPISDQILNAKQLEERVEVSILDFYKELKISLDKHSSLPIREIIVVSPDEVRFMLDSNTLALAMQKGIGNQLSSLQAICESPTIERAGKTIDLRFQNPVLK